MKSLLFFLFLLVPCLVYGQSLLSCNFTVVNQTAVGGVYSYYAFTLHFSGAVSIPGYTTAPDSPARNQIWWRVRERVRMVSNLQPDIDIIASKDFEPGSSLGFYYNTDLILGNSLRLNPVKHINNGEQITVSYWRPPVTPGVDLLVGGAPMGDFECTATMPNVTRMVQQSTFTTTYSAGSLNLFTLVFSQPVVRCGGGGLPVNVTDLHFTSGASLSAACNSLVSFSDQRVYYCRDFASGYASYMTSGYFWPLWPSNVCDRATGIRAERDAFGWNDLNRGASQQLVMALAAFELWALNATSRALAFAFPGSSLVPPVPDSASVTLRLGVPGGSQALWYPISGWSSAGNNTFLGLYPLSVPEMGISISSYSAASLAPGSLYCVNILSRIVQRLGSPSGLNVSFEFAFYDSANPSSYAFTFALYSGTTDLLATATSNPSLGVYTFAGATEYLAASSTLFGYIYTTGYVGGAYTTQVYSQRVYPQTVNPLPIRLISAHQSVFTLTLTFNNSLPLSQAVIGRLAYSCGSLSGLSITGSQTVQVTSSGQYCAGATLTLSADAVWTSEQAFPSSQVFTNVTGAVTPFFSNCSIEQITTDNFGSFYAMVLYFAGPVTFSRAESPSDSDINWPRVRSRMRITSSRNPGYDLLTAKEQLLDTISASDSNPYVVSGNTLRVVVGLTLEEGENVTLRYWQPPVATLVDLLVLGTSVPDFECTATMPAVTRLVSQVTVFEYIYNPSLVSYLPAIDPWTVLLTFSRPVARCDTGGLLTTANFLVNDVYGGQGPLSALCTGLEPLYDQRTWRCTGFSSDLDYMYPFDITGSSYYVKYIQPTGVCDRARNTTAVSDLRNCWDASTAPSLGLVFSNNLGWFGQNWAFDPDSRQMAYQYESCGSYVPINGSSPTPVLFQGGLAGASSAVSWFPVSLLPVAQSTSGSFSSSFNYSMTYLPLSLNFTLRPSTLSGSLSQGFNAYRPNFLVSISQSINQTSGRLLVTFSYSYSSAVSSNRPVLIASSVNGSANLLSGVTGSSSLSHTWPLSDFTFFRTDLWGYIESIRTTGGNAFLQTYSQPVNAGISLLRLASATLSADGTSLRLVFNQTTSSTLLFFNPSLVSLSCGTPLTLLSFNSTFVDLSTAGLCPEAALALESNLTWTADAWFYLPQTFSSFNYTPMVFTEARLLNGSLLELYVPLEANASELFFDPAQLRLTCNGSSSANATVHPNGTVTGCWPPLGVRLEILGTGALTDGVRGLDPSLVGTEWVVFVSSEVNEDCQVDPCPGPPGPKNRNDFFRLSIGWILGATLIPGFVGWLLGLMLGLKLVPPIKYHLLPHDVYRVGDVYNDHDL